MSLIKQDTPEHLPPYIPPLFFLSIFSFSKLLSTSQFSPFRWNPPLPGRISDDTWYTVKTKTSTTITQTYIYFSLFFPCLFLGFRLFPSFDVFIFSSLFYLFPLSLKCRKTKKNFLRRSSSLNKERNITTKPVVSVWFIYFSTCFYHNNYKK